MIPDPKSSILAHGVGGSSPEIWFNLDEVVSKAKKSGKKYIELSVCEAGQHDKELLPASGKNIVEILHERTNMPIKYTEDYVRVKGTKIWLANSPTAKKHGWQWIK